MRVWDIPPQFLCRPHLLGEHRELHAIWKILTVNNGQGGYAKHPETLRWRYRLKALYIYHDKIIREMKNRGYHHYSQLDKQLATGKAKQDRFVNTIKEQKQILKSKGCQCFGNI